jgi:tetratricopeptide (TPR) repeat protein
MHEAWYNWGTDLGALARQTGDASYYEQAFDKYQQAVTIKPDKHEAWNGLGIIHAYRKEFNQAIKQFEKALSLSQKAKDSESERIYAGNIVQALLDSTLEHMTLKNIGEVHGLFEKALALKSQLDEKNWNERLLKFFKDFISKENTIYFYELYNILNEKSFEEEVELLSPFAIASEYWQKNEDAEVLDRLNPEVREIVEEIIKKSYNGLNDSA